jgi:hypothetical protein
MAISLKGILSDQKKRLSNVGSTFKALGTNVASVFSKKVEPVKIVANTPYARVNKVIEVVSNNPIKTAAVVGTGALAVRAATGNAPGIVRAASSATAAVKSKAKAIVGKARSAATPGLTTGTTADVAKANAPTSSLPVSTAGGLITPSTSSPRSTASRTPRKRKAAKRSTRRTTKRRKTKRSTGRRTKRRTGYGTERAYKRKGGKSVKYTKNGQPYIITSSGKARFIKRSKR